MESTENIDFHNSWCILKRRLLPAVTTFGSVVALTFLYTSLKPPIYKAQGELLFRQDKSPSMIGLGSAEQTNSQSEDLHFTESLIIRSTPVLQKALDLINKNNPYGKPLNLRDLQQKLDVKNIEKTDILKIDYTSTDPNVAALVVNQLMNVYIDNNLAANRAAASSAGNFISGQLPLVKANVDRADQAVRSFKEKNKIADLGQTQAAVAANIERIGAQINSVEAQISDLNSRSTALQNQLGMSSQQAMAVSSLSQSPAVQGVLADLQEVKRKLADARSRYRESTPVIVNLEDKEAQINTLLQEQVAQVLQGRNLGPNGKLQVGTIHQELMAELIKSEVTRRGLVTQLATLSSQKAFYQRQVAILPRLEQQQRQLARELSAAQSTYETLLKSLQDLKVKENQAVANVRIIEPAQVPAVPFNAYNISTIAAIILLGILLTAAVVYILEVRDKKIKTIKEARELFEYKLLGTVPVFEQTSRAVNSFDQAPEKRGLRLPVIESPSSFISESYRMIQANLKFCNSDKALKVIAVTSSVPKEGKSTTCANLAAVMATSGYNVLIIDADIRCPSQHQIWQISNEVGLINVIAGQTSLSGNVIQNVMKNLYVLTTGASTSTPPVLFDDKNIAALIEQCQDQYHYILIDTPPLAIAADASILGRIADGVVLVTRPGVADAISSKLTKEYLDQSNQNILGLVVNGIVPENEPYSDYYYKAAYYQEPSFRESAPHTKKDWLANLSFFKRS